MTPSTTPCTLTLILILVGKYSAGILWRVLLTKACVAMKTGHRTWAKVSQCDECPWADNSTQNTIKMIYSRREAELKQLYEEEIEFLEKDFQIAMKELLSLMKRTKKRSGACKKHRHSSSSRLMRHESTQTDWCDKPIDHSYSSPTSVTKGQHDTNGNLKRFSLPRHSLTWTRHGHTK